MPEPDVTLRDRLAAMQRGTLAQLAGADRLDAGLMRLVADSSAVLAALDAGDDAGVTPEPAGRAVVLDDNQKITLAVFSADRQAAATVLSPVAAIRLGNQLVAAGIRRL